MVLKTKSEVPQVLMMFCSVGQQTLQHSGDILDTQVVLNSTLDFVCSEVSPEVKRPL